MITKDKVTEIFCIIDEFDKNFESELKKNLLPVTDGKQHRNRKASLSDSEIMTILLLFHFGTYRNFKHYYIYYIREHMKRDFPNAVSYNRFIELEQRVFFNPTSTFPPQNFPVIQHLQFLHIYCGYYKFSNSTELG